MTYYRIKESIDKKIIGKYPQVEEVIIPTTWEDPAFIGCYTNTRAPRNVLVPKAILNKTSKVTDLVSGVAVGLARNLLVSDELKFLLEVSNYYGVDFFETSLKVFNAEELSYWIVHPYKSYYEALDLEKSSFFFGLTSTFSSIQRKEFI